MLSNGDRYNNKNLVLFQIEWCKLYNTINILNLKEHHNYIFCRNIMTNVVGKIQVDFGDYITTICEQNLIVSPEVSGIQKLEVYENILDVSTTNANYQIPVSNIRGFYSETDKGDNDIKLITRLVIYTNDSPTAYVINLNKNHPSYLELEKMHWLSNKYIGDFVIPYNYKIHSATITYVTDGIYDLIFHAVVDYPDPTKFPLTINSYNNTIADPNGLQELDVALDTTNVSAGNAIYIEYTQYKLQGSLVITMKQGEYTIDLSIASTDFAYLLRCQKYKTDDITQLITNDYIIDRLTKYSNVIVKISNNKCYISHEFGPFIIYDLPLDGVFIIKKVSSYNSITKVSVFSLPDIRLIDCINGNVNYADNGVRCTNFMGEHYCRWNNGNDCMALQNLSSCNNGMCVEDANGTTPADCANNCIKKYSCKSGKCVHDINGTMLLDECTKSCSSSWYLWVILIIIVIIIVGYYVVAKSSYVEG